MKISLKGTELERAGVHTIHAAIEKDGENNPINLKVEFVDGEAECDDNLAQLLIDQGLAEAGAGNAKPDKKKAAETPTAPGTTASAAS
jgi:hypothetical protein